MKPEQHAQRAHNVMRSMEKLRAQDYEMLIEASMIAGTQLFNVCLHRLGITGDAEDVMHAEYMSGLQRIKTSLLAPGLAEMLDEIEQLRPAYVRGDFEGGQAAAQRCVALLRSIQARAARRPGKRT